MKIHLLLLLLLFYTSIFAQEEKKETTVIFSGFAKLDMMFSNYRNGTPKEESPIEDIHIPGAIPVGDRFDVYDTHFHVKESRLLFDIESTILGKRIHAYAELDFLLSKAGDERVSNSYNPRLRQFYFEWGNFLFGQTWSTFMVVIIPEDLDFAGAAEGIVFNRQPQFRYTHKTWQFSIENPELTITPYRGGNFITSSGGFPDIIGRKNFNLEKGKISLAGIVRGLRYYDEDNVRHFTHGLGLTTGGKFAIGERDDIRFMATIGRGLGRYIALGFLNAVVLDQNNDLTAINSFNAYVAYLHHWNDQLMSSFNVSTLIADNDAALTGNNANKSAWSVSGNIIYKPAPPLLFGVETMYGYRELEGGTNGAFFRIQFSAKYNFQFSHTFSKQKQ
jgi:hypothetical protein